MNRTVRLFLCVAAALPCAFSQARAQDAANGPWITDTLTSATLKEKRTLLVALPTGYEASADSFPVLVLLDAGDRPQFEAAVANVNFLASRSEIPGLIIVGVRTGTDRPHDMTPPITGDRAKDMPSAGGADAFETFIADEALPFIRRTYRARHQTILAGHSLGGLFGLYVAATEKNPYMGIIAMSPSLWVNDSTVAHSYADSIASLTTGQRIFVTSGAFESPIDVTARHFIARLDSLQPRGISYAYHGYADDTHALTPQPSLIAGLRFVFEPVSVARLPLSSPNFSWDSAAFVHAVTSSEATYARGARSLDLPETLPEAVLNQLGYGVLLEMNMPKVAAWLFKQNVANYPGSANVYDSYGDGLGAVGDTTGAIAQYEHAVKLFEARHDSAGAAMSRAKLTRLQKAASGSGGKDHR
jgi:predicted alpha/beta superfamily hydrolase